MKTFLKFTFIAIILFYVSSCAEPWDRAVKNVESDFIGGTKRKVSVYDYNGEIIKSWEGKFNTQMGDANGVDANGLPYVKFYIPDSTGGKKRVIVQGGIIINEEI